MQIVYVAAYIVALYLLTIEFSVYDIVLWWAVIVLPTRRGIRLGQWPVAVGIIVSSMNPAVNLTSIFGGAIIGAYSAYSSRHGGGLV